MHSTIPTPLFIFEMANNHMGDLEHGLRIVREFKEVTRAFSSFRFSIKLQHRDDSFFHPEYRTRMDYKYIKRFSETKLLKENFRTLKCAIQDAGFISMCTPWDEPSVDLMEELGFDIIKVASCSFTDWPLLERIVKSSRPVIASTAAAEGEDIDRVVSFFTHREKSFALMHCVGEYPCSREHLELNQIDYFKRRYSNVTIGYSTHEDPDNLDSIRIAVAKGAVIFEKHIAVPTLAYPANAYSATPAQAQRWLAAAEDAYAMCGATGRRRPIFDKEINDIEPLLRGVFATRMIFAGQKMTPEDYFLAMPNRAGQLLAKNLSKYSEFRAKTDIPAGAPIMLSDLDVSDLREHVHQIVQALSSTLKSARIALPPYVDLEISHHYGVAQFWQSGAVLIHLINRVYSKIIVVMFPGQSYPRHCHLKKAESYHLLTGDLTVEVEGSETILKAGDILSITRGTKHSFKTNTGAVIEEVATTYIKGDSIYDDDQINADQNRKLFLTFWPDWLSS